MNRIRPVLSASSLFLITVAATAQSVSVYEGPAAGPGDVLVLDIATKSVVLQPSALTAVTLLPIEFSGRTEIQRLLPTRPRLRADVPGASRLQLPGGSGSLYKYARDEGASGVAFGFFAVDGTGVARSLIERRSRSFQDDPFLSRIAVAPDGGAILVATTAGAGAELLEVRVSDGHVDAIAVPATAAERALSISPTGLVLGSTWGIASSNLGVLRFERGAASTPEWVAFEQPAPRWISDDVVTSDNGDFAILVAGEHAGLAHVWVFDATGPARRVSETPNRFSGGGFLPEYSTGPHLAVSNDGRYCAWRLEIDGHYPVQELVLAEVAPATGPAPVHITSDTNFHPYIDGIGQYIFSGSRLLFLAGEGLLAGAVIDTDLYSAQLTTGAPQIRNLSASSGTKYPPFLQVARIDPVGTVWVPEANQVVLFDTAKEEIINIRSDQSGTEDLIDDVLTFDLLERVGTDLAIGARSEEGMLPYEVSTVSAQLSHDPEVVFSNYAALALDRPAARADGWLAFVETLASGERVHLVEVATGALQVLSPAPAKIGPNLAFAPNGDLVFSVGVDPQPAVFMARPVQGSLTPLRSANRPGFVLPGP